jgi:hypothetical protein
MRDKSYFYDAPFIQCRNPNPDTTCEAIRLPYPDLKARDRDAGFLLGGSDLPDWPPDEWRAVFGCTSCGLVYEYTSADVDWRPVPTSAPGTFQGAICFRVEFRCAHTGCKTQAAVHVEMAGADEASIRKLFRDGFFVWQLPCGHSLLPLPEAACQIWRVIGPIETA